MFDAIIFDSDGVLVDSEVLGIAIECHALANLGLHYERAEFKQRFLGMHDAAFVEALNEDSQSRLGQPLPADFLHSIDRHKDAVYENELTAVPGIASLLTKVPHATAVASSASADRLARNLHLTGLFDFFAPHVYSADLVSMGKPAPDIFLYAADRIGQPPPRCLVIEDSVNGVKAGKAAGMAVWGFIGGGHADEALGERLVDAGADALFRTHAEIGQALQQKL